MSYEIVDDPIHGYSLSLYGCNLQTSDDLDSFIDDILTKLPNDIEYSMIVFSALAEHPPSWSSLYRLYFYKIPYSYKKNLKKVYLVHGNTWMVRF